MESEPVAEELFESDKIVPAPTFLPSTTYRIPPATYTPPLTTTTAVSKTSTSAEEPTSESTVHEFLKHLPWLQAFIKDDLITIDDKEYHIGNKQTVVEEKTCKVAELEGKCTLLSACPDVYSKLIDLETYKKEYFCTLESDK